jgi:hypothetical protein
MVKEANTSETSVKSYETKWRNILEDFIFTILNTETF